MLRRFLKASFLILLLIPVKANLTAAEFDMVTGGQEPYSFDDGSGYLDRIAKEAFQRIGHIASVKSLPAKRALIVVDRGESDGDMQRIKGLEKQFPNIIMVPEPVSQYTFTAFSKEPNKTFPDGYQSLKGKTVSYLRGWKIYENNVPENVQVTFSNTPSNLLSLLDKKRVDYILYSKWSGLYWSHKNEIKIWPVTPAFNTIDLHIYLHKKHKDIVPLLSNALKAMKEDGSYHQIEKETLLYLEPKS